MGLILFASLARAQSPGIGFVIPEEPIAYLEDSVKREYYIPVQCVGTIPKDSVLSVSVTVMKGSTAQIKLDFELDAEPLLLVFDSRTARVQYVKLVVKADTLVDVKEHLTLLLQGQDAFSRASIVTSDDRITVQIGDISEKKPASDSFKYLSKFNYPLRFSIGTSLNVIDKEKVGGNIYFDVMALDQDIIEIPWGKKKDLSPDGEHFKEYGLHCPKKHNPHFGGYFRVVQEQGVAVINGRVVPLTFQRPISRQVGRVAADSTLSVEREYFNYKLASTTVRSSGVTLGFNLLAYSSPAQARAECKISLGLHGELIKREILSTYEKTAVFKDTVRMKSNSFLRDAARGEMALQQRLNSFDGYFGLSSTVLYRFGDVEFIAIPSVGFVGTTLADNNPAFEGLNKLRNNLYMNVYAVITERKFGFTLGCDLKTIPGSNTVNSFNIFANKAFALDKVADALRFN
ncbi:hypothetical protein [Hymenobacter algoricola]|uniref:DUF5723 domain-containing protein n=1 Tax=Hymenobacter algoricola TaxID=486267 RepID=A0ABP7MA83_9BACT